MLGLFIIVTALLALPLLYPEAVVHWLKAAQTWIEQRRVDKNQEIAELEAQVETQNEWANWLASARRRLRTPIGKEDHDQLLTQTLAAGERFLQNADAHAFPRLYDETKRLCARLLTHHAQHKKGPGKRLTLHESAG